RRGAILARLADVPEGRHSGTIQGAGLMTSLDLDRHLDRSRRRPGHYTWLARIPFLVFSLGGMVGLIVLKYFEIDQFIICGVAAALILVYAVSVALIPALRIREDQLGDNCYYLGFLYTLTSLG